MKSAWLDDVFDPRERGFFEDLVNQGVDEARVVLKDIENDRMCDTAEQYLELLELQKARLKFLEHLQACLEPVMEE